MCFVLQWNHRNQAILFSKTRIFSDLEDIIVVYISELDIFGEDKVLYHVDSVIRETGTIIHDGLERIFVNAEVKDGTTVSEFMECFLEKEVNNPKFPKLTDRMYHLKHERGGLNTMCEVMEKYERQAAEKAAAKAAAKASKDANVKAIKYMITAFNASKANILQDYSEEEYSIALRELKAEKTRI